VLKRALTNVIDNAVKFGGNAEVGLHETAEYVTVVVEDQGPGIPESEMEAVFNPFYRVETSRSRDTGGVGLGLSVARSIIDAHGGSIALANRPTGGLRVTIELPRDGKRGS
jgi:signal transduction histidine kinase